MARRPVSPEVSLQHGRFMFRFAQAMLLVRVSTDALPGSSAIDAGLAGIFSFLTLAAFGRWALSGVYRPTSGVTKAAYGVAITAFLSVIRSTHAEIAGLASLGLLSGVLMFGLLEQLLADQPDRVRALMKTLLWSSLVPVMLGIYQLATNTGDHETAGYNRLVGPAVTPAGFANYLIVPTMIALAVVRANRGDRKPVRRFVLWIAIFTYLALVFLTYTRSAWIAVGVACGVLIWRLNRKFMLPLVLVIGYIALAVPSVSSRFADLKQTQGVTITAAPNSLAWRFSYWHQILPLARYNPLTGIGLNTVDVSTPTGFKAHDIGVEAYVEMGVLGLGAVAIWVVLLAVTLYRRRRRAATPLEKSVAGAAIAIAVGLLIQALTNNLLTQAMMWWYLAAGMSWGFAMPKSGSTSNARAEMRSRPARSRADPVWVARHSVAGPGR